MRFLVLCLVFMFSAISMANSGSAQVSCRGSLDGHSYGIEIYQYANVANGKVQAETHLIETRGILGVGGLYKILSQASREFVYHSNGQYVLAVPYISQDHGAWLTTSPLQKHPKWIRLCQ